MAKKKKNKLGKILTLVGAALAGLGGYDEK